MNMTKTKTITIEDVCFYRDYEGNVRGDIDYRRDGVLTSESFGIYASGNWEFKGWQNRRFLTREQKKALETAIIAKVAA